MFTRRPRRWRWAVNGPRRHLEPGLKAQIYVRMLSKSEAWRAARVLATAKANAKRSDAAKGNRNAAKDAKNSRVSRDTPLNEGRKERERKAVAKTAEVSEPTAARALALEKKRPDLADKVQVNLRLDAAR